MKRLLTLVVSVLVILFGTMHAVHAADTIGTVDTEKLSVLTTKPSYSVMI